MRNCPVCTRIEKCPVLEQAPARQAAGPCRVSPPSQICRRTSCARGRFSRAGNVAVATGKLPRERMGWSRRVQAPKAPHGCLRVLGRWVQPCPLPITVLSGAAFSSTSSSSPSKYSSSSSAANKRPRVTRSHQEKQWVSPGGWESVKGHWGLNYQGRSPRRGRPR